MKEENENNLDSLTEKDIVIDESLGNFDEHRLEMTNSLNNLTEIVEKESKDKKKSRKVLIPIIASLVMVLILSGASFAYYNARITKIRETETVFKTNVLGLIYTGVHEVDVSGIIPGDSFTKTFTVYNSSNRTVTFNLFIEEITSTFNEDLKITVTDNKGNTVVSQRAMPGTNAGKEYIATDISIDSEETIEYTMTIEYVYSDNTDQSDYMGAEFEGHVMIDTERIEAPVALTSPIAAGTAIYYNPQTNQVCDNYAASNSASGVASGCMKWYVLPGDTDKKSKINLLLDHNINEGVNKDDLESTLASTVSTNHWSNEIEARLPVNDEVYDYFDAGSYIDDSADWLYDNVSLADENYSDTNTYYEGHYAVKDDWRYNTILYYYDTFEEPPVNAKKMWEYDGSYAGIRPVVNVSKTAINATYGDVRIYNPGAVHDGTVVYLNPETAQKCNNYVAANSASEVASGCLKWYVVDDDGTSNIKLLLDHNVSERVDYERDTSHPELTLVSQAFTSVAYDNNWHNSLTPRLLKYSEIEPYFNYDEGDGKYTLFEYDSRTSWLYSNVTNGRSQWDGIENTGHYIIEGDTESVSGGYAIVAMEDEYTQTVDYGLEQIVPLYVANGARPVITVPRSTLD